MLLSTTSTLEGRTIREYRGVVFGEAISGIDFVKDIGANIANILGGRAKEYERELVDARADALREMMDRATRIGANAIVGVSVDVEAMGQGGMIMVSASGTAVVIEEERL